jgi:uncharacterized membrane protein YccF (DUF307 family)
MNNPEVRLAVPAPQVIVPAPPIGPAPTPMPDSVPAHARVAPVVVVQSSGPSMVIRAIWFIFVGWWLSLLAIAAAYFLCLTIIGLPFGFALFNLLPAIITLRPRTMYQSARVADGVMFISGRGEEQYALWLRGLYFILVGWWLGALYLSLAWFLCVILVGLPIGLWMFNRTGAVMTLLRY